MSIETIDECYGCAECIGCWRKGRSHKIVVCDGCGKEIEQDAEPHDGEHFCDECLESA